MAACDINTLMAKAACVNCLDDGQLDAITAYLICQWLDSED